METAVQNQQAQPQEKKVDEQKRKRLRCIALLDQILGDASRDSKEYVKNYHVGRGAE